MLGQIVGYARVSSTSQNLERQLATIGDVEEIFTDHVSGKNRQDRAGLESALRYLRRGDTLRVASMDRFARSLVDLEQLVDELTSRGGHRRVRQRTAHLHARLGRPIRHLPATTHRSRRRATGYPDTVQATRLSSK